MPQFVMFPVSNRTNLSKLSFDMSKQDVARIMGTQTVRDPSGYVSNPYKVETAKAPEGGNLEILFYYTETKKHDDVITDDELTPLVFKDNKLVGWGWSYMNGNTQKVQVDIRSIVN